MDDPDSHGRSVPWGLSLVHTLEVRDEMGCTKRDWEKRYMTQLVYEVSNFNKTHDTGSFDYQRRSVTP